MADIQRIPARHGVATFVPAGQIIKIVNTSGTQRVNVWAFALPSPDGKKNENRQDENKASEKLAEGNEDEADTRQTSRMPKEASGAFPSQNDAKKATRETLGKEWTSPKGGSSDSKTAKSSFTAYLPKTYMPSLGFGKQNVKETSEGLTDPAEQTSQQKDSRAWASYFPSGQAFSSTGRTWSSYIPKQASDAVSQFAATHQRDPTKSYLAQLQDFSRTPVGAAGLAKVTGSGYGSSLYAAYSAYNNLAAATAPVIEHLSLAHTSSATGSLYLHVGDTLITNLRQPILMLVEDTSSNDTSKSCAHDTLSPACDPALYHASGASDWAEHGSRAENLVLALKELNERAGLKGARAVGAQVTVNNCPTPLGLFSGMRVEDGKILYSASSGNAKVMVRMRAHRDVVIVMSACPNDTGERKPADAHFLVEEKEVEHPSAALQRAMQQPVSKKPVKKKQTAASSGEKTSGTITSSAAPPKPSETEEMQPSETKSARSKTPSIKTEKSDVTQKPTGAGVKSRGPDTSAADSKTPATSELSTPAIQEKTNTSQKLPSTKRNPVPKAPPPRKQKTDVHGASALRDAGEDGGNDASEPKTPQVRKKPTKLSTGSKKLPASAAR